MQRSRRLLVVFTTVVVCWWPRASSAQEQAKVDKKQEKKIKKELSASYGPWLDNEVPYIITPEERRALLGLSANEEREQFIEIFWNSRNSDRESPVNTFKEELCQWAECRRGRTSSRR